MSNCGFWMAVGILRLLTGWYNQFPPLDNSLFPQSTHNPWNHPYFPTMFWHHLMGFHMGILGHCLSFISALGLLLEKRSPFDGIHNGLIQMEGTWGALAGSTASLLSTPHHLCSTGLGHPQETQSSRSWGQAPGPSPVPGHLTLCLNLSTS